MTPAAHTPAQRLRRIVEASGLSQRAFAVRVLAMAPPTLSRYLTGRAVIPKTLIAWMDSLPNPSVAEPVGRLVGGPYPTPPEEERDAAPALRIRR